MACRSPGKSLPPTYVEGYHNKEVVLNMVYNPLGQTGLQVSILALGASALGNIYGLIDEEEGIFAVREAIQNGINYIDTAYWYGQGKSEELLGKALKEIPRQAYYIGTKVGRYELDMEAMFDFSFQRTIKSVDDSLTRLGLDYVDIIQIHDLEFASDSNIVFNETLPALEHIKKEGKAHFIGITGYPLTRLRDCLEKSAIKIDTILSYCRCTLQNLELLDFIPFFQSKGVGIINAAALSMGLLTVQGPQKWHPASEEIKDLCLKAIKFCQEKGVDISKLALKFSLLQQGVHTTLVSIPSRDVLHSNLNNALIPLTNTEELVLKEIQERFFIPIQAQNWENMEMEKFKFSQK